MITAIDTNILLSAFSGAEAGSHAARHAIHEAIAAGPLTTSVICYAEMTRSFTDRSSLDQLLAGMECTVTAVDPDTAFLAGRYFEEYRKRGGEKSRILADFLIAADAVLHADRILTHDKRFFGTQFPGLIAVGYSDG